jgi:ABC-type transporter Mla subunit MlaD
MKTETMDLTVGALTAGALALAVAVLIWLFATARDETYPLRTHFSDIAGLSEQGAVYLRGYEIGRVREIRPVVTPEGLLVFEVWLDVRWSLAGAEAQALPAGTTAVLKPAPILGTASVELQLPDQPGTARLRPGDAIHGSAEVPLTEQAARLSGTLVYDVGHTLEAARMLLDTLTRTTATAQRLIAGAEQSLPEIVHRATAQLDVTHALTQELRALTPAVLATVDSANLLIRDSRTVIDDAHAVFVASDPQFQLILQNLENTSLVLDYFTRTVAGRPTRLLTGVEIPTVDSLRVLQQRFRRR